MYVVEIGFSAIAIWMSSPYFAPNFSQVSSYSPTSVSFNSLFAVMSRSALSGGLFFLFRMTRSPACRSRNCARFSFRTAMYLLPTRIGILVALSFMGGGVVIWLLWILLLFDILHQL